MRGPKKRITTTLWLLGVALGTIHCSPTSRFHNSGDNPTDDRDGDGYTVGDGDCNDNNAMVHPGGTEVCGDNLDNDCDGIVDNTCDNDHDGYAIQAGNGFPGGDCDDNDPMINPGAMEVPGDKVDNNCDTNIDEAPRACDNTPGRASAGSLAGAMELCAPWVMDAQINRDASPQAYATHNAFGSNYLPKQGMNFTMLSTGLAADETTPGFVPVQPGTEFDNDQPNPLPMAQNTNACGSGPDEATVHDYLELRLTLKVPTNANSFSFNFMFTSAEYPEYVGSAYNDKFLAILDSKNFQGNISFDGNKNPITVNTSFFDVCETATVCDGKMTNTCSHSLDELIGTGYEQHDQNDPQPYGGGTGWLTTTAPVTPGEIIHLRFIIFDEGDSILDSSVILDNFKWNVAPSSGPNTIG